MSAIGDRKRAELIDAGIALGRAGMHKVTIRAASQKIGTTNPLVLYYFGTAKNFRQAVIDAAYERNDQEMIARLIMDNHPSARRLDRQTRRMYLATIGAR